jgi:hypothetical protein
MARADTDHEEAKVGIAGKSGALSDTSIDTGTSPTAVAVAPSTPPPAAAAPGDIFTKGGVSQSKVSGDLAAGSPMTNVFADAQINEKLKDAPGVPDNSMLVVVNAGNPSATNQQLRDYFANNGIKWDAAEEPMPPPLELRESQTIMRSRLNNTQMNLKGGPAEGAPTAGGFGGSGGAGGQGYGSLGGQTAPSLKQDAQQDREFARAQEETKLKPAAEADKNIDQSKVAATPPYPSRVGGEPAPAPVAADTQNKQLREREDAKSGAAASSVNGTGAGANAAAAPRANGTSVAVGGRGVAQKDAAQNDTADPDRAKRQAAADEITQVQIPSQPQAGAAEQSSPRRRPRANRSPPAPRRHQRRRSSNSRSHANTRNSNSCRSRRRANRSSSSSTMQSPQTHQVFIARGLTRQQVAAMNGAISNGNRINTTTAPALPSRRRRCPRSARPRLPPRARLPWRKRNLNPAATARASYPLQRPLRRRARLPVPRRGFSRRCSCRPHVVPTTGAPPSPHSSTNPTWRRRHHLLRPPRRAPQPTTTATASTDGAAAGDRVDVVILVQPEPEPVGNSSNCNKPPRTPRPPRRHRTRRRAATTTAPHATRPAPATSPAPARLDRFDVAWASCPSISETAMN